MRESFPGAVSFVLSREGGYSLDPLDPGGETKFGISKHAHPDEDIKGLTEDRARQIYCEEYWVPIADALPFPADVVAFDAAVNQGLSFAREMVHECGTDAVAMLMYRLKRYSVIVQNRPASLKYLRGWMNRVVDLYTYIKEAP